MMNKTHDVISRSRWITVIYRYSSEWHSEGLKMSRFAAVRSGNHAVSHNLSLALCQSLTNTFRLLSLLFESQQPGLSEWLRSRETETPYVCLVRTGRGSREVLQGIGMPSDLCGLCEWALYNGYSKTKLFKATPHKQTHTTKIPSVENCQLHVMYNFPTWGVIFFWYSLGILQEVRKGFKTDASAFQKKLVLNQSGGLEQISASRNYEATAKELVVFDHNSSENADICETMHINQNCLMLPNEMMIQEVVTCKLWMCWWKRSIPSVLNHSESDPDVVRYSYCTTKYSGCH